MAVQKFEDLLVWQKAQDFVVLVYSNFSGLKDYAFKDQITRASLSVSNNIAEGFDRKTNTVFTRFLYIAVSSNSEARSMLYLAQRLEYLKSEKIKELLDRSNEISRMIFGLIQSMKPN